MTLTLNELLVSMLSLVAFEYVQKLIMQKEKEQSLGKKIIVVLTFADINICSLVCGSDHIKIFDVPLKKKRTALWVC